MTIEQLEPELLELSAREQARLAERLLASLDDESSLERRWYDEADRRLAELEAGVAREGSPGTKSSGSSARARPHSVDVRLHTEGRA